METEILIVGGGLAGLALARLLEQNGIDYRLIDARDRLGGRILTQTVKVDGQTGQFDLGPAWVWPGQPRIAKMLNTLNIRVFDQYSKGENLFEDANGILQKGFGFASMAGSYRIEGGLDKLISRISEQLSPTRLLLNRSADQISYDGDTVATDIRFGDGSVETIKSKRVVLAIPPRLIAEKIRFPSGIPENALAEMRKIPTWMAGQAKVLAVYDTPFWREAGFSGDVISQSGPIRELHDASPEKNAPYALFGFLGSSHDYRLNKKDHLLEAVRAQLGSFFGQKAASPLKLLLKDWAQDANTSTKLDHANLNYHPTYGLPRALSNLYQGQLILGSTEVAPEYGGFLEGALEAADNAFHVIQQHRNASA